jgi:hypothetical protein
LKAAFNQFAKGYLFSAWMPSVFALSVFGLLFINELKLHIPYIGFALLFFLVVSLLGILVSGIVQLVRGRKLWGAINLAALPIIGLIVVYGIGFIAFAGLFNDEPDNFGKNIVIPADMKVSDSVESFDEPSEYVNDEFTDKVIAAFSTNSTTNAQVKISTRLAILNEFGTTNRQKLIQHLAASPRWFVTEEGGKPYAYRRLTVGGRWQNSLNGFFSSSSVAPSFEPNFQTRIVIGFDGPVFVEPFQRKGIFTAAQVGSGDVPIRVVDDKEANQGKESYFVLQSPRASVEIFEQSGVDARPITQLAIAEVKQELEAALVSTDTEMSPEQIAQRTGEAEIQLAKGMQGGIYQVRAFVNPGESGRVYIKVFEATQNTPLSAERIKPASISRIGWSTNSNEKFRYQSEITVYEGDWGTFYPGRFELWFIPDSGGSERKLIDRIFRIEGWMR